MFTVYVSLVLGSEFVQFRIIGSISYAIIVDIFEVDLYLGCLYFSAVQVPYFTCRYFIVGAGICSRGQCSRCE